MNGTVVEFDEAKGYGTVRGDDGVEHFFHGKLNELRDAVTRFARKN